MPYISYSNDEPINNSIHMSNDHGNNFSVTTSCDVDSIHIPTGECDECEAFEQQVEELREDIGNLNNLQTPHKNNLVNAINDVVGSSLVLDNALSPDSTNAVENQAIYAGLTTRVPYPHAGGGIIYGNNNQVLASDGTPNGTKWVNISGAVNHASMNVWGTVMAAGSHDPGGGSLEITYDNNGNDTSVDLVALSSQGKIWRDQLPTATTTTQGAVILDDTLAVSGQAADAKAVGDTIGDLSNLTTSVTTDLVSAINDTDKFFIAEYGVTVYADVKAAYDDGKIVVMQNGDDYVFLTLYEDNTFRFVQFLFDGKCYRYNNHYSGWSTEFLTFVPSTRKINNKLLTADINLTSTDVDAAPRPSTVGTDGQALVIRTGGDGWWTEWATISSGGGTQNVWYGTCNNEPGATTRTVTTSSGDFTLATGNVVYVLMNSTVTAANPITLNVDSTGAKDLYIRYNTSGSQTESNYGAAWQPGEVICCIYDGVRFIAVNKPKATSSYYGITKLDTALSTAGLAADSKAVGDAISAAVSSIPIANDSTYGLVKVERTINVNGGGYFTFTYHTPQDVEESYTAPYLASLGPGSPDPVVGRDYLPSATTSAKGAVVLDRTLTTQDKAADAKAVGDAMPTSASINSSGLISFKNASNTSVFTLQLPIYNGGVTP